MAKGNWNELSHALASTQCFKQGRGTLISSLSPWVRQDRIGNATVTNKPLNLSGLT